VELWVEFLGVVEPVMAVRDAALYVVDSAAALVRNNATGLVTMPLLANSGFGAPTAYRTSGRVVRFGVQVGYE
jgi:hypothetical protein